jgi:hypothetical protein
MLADVVLSPRFALGLLTLEVTVFDAHWHLLLLKERQREHPRCSGRAGASKPIAAASPNKTS